MGNVEKNLLKIKAVFLRPDEPFTWASGIKSPIYCDNRLILSYPMVRTMVELEIAETIKKEFPGVEMLMGTATAGIAHAALAANNLDLPMGYVRSSAKSHGRENKIEGFYKEGQKVVVVEDLISTGGSSIECVNALREAKLDVLGVVSIFTYNLEEGFKNFENANCKYVSIANYDDLIKEAVELNYIKEADLAKLKAWKTNPHDESWIEK
ncbi:MAG: orotate phosphoribosyltransferase [bacterium]|nr:orotate phosphoribosyltransferase [bacterium]